MGLTASSSNNLKHNEHLLRLTDKKNIRPDENFWDELLTFTFKNTIRSSDESRELEEKISSLLERLSNNNQTSRNLGSLVKVFIGKVSQLILCSNDDDKNYNLILCQTYNSLYILRCCTKHLIQTLTEDNVIKNFNALVIIDEKTSTDDPGSHIIEQFIRTLIEILVDIPNNDYTYSLHVETINMLLVLLSVQMFTMKSANKSLIYKCIMQKKCSIHSLLLIKYLLTNIIQEKPVPNNDGSGSMIIGLASGLWNVLTLGYGRVSEDASGRAILAQSSILFLLVLTNHCTNDMNAYRDALFNCCDISVTTEGGDHAISGFKIEFLNLIENLCKHQSEDQYTLLLYMLLHKNPSFRTYVLSRTSELDLLVMPILKILYDSAQRSSHHIYMALIILLILSEDSLFNEAIHDITLKNVTWYTEKHLNEISLGGFIILVIIRTIRYNISRTRDKFLHTNLLATLANMSNYFKRLNPYVCQKIVDIFDKLSKRMNKILNQINQTQTSNGIEHSSDQDTISEIASLAGSADVMHDLSIYEEVLRMILEIINACLANQLTHNPNLIYTLLYNRNIFDSFQSHPSFQDIVINIETVLTYFANRVDSRESTQSVTEVYEIIKHSSLQWPSERLKKFPELRFRYVEDDQPEEFFIPYIWSLVYRSSGLHFNTQNISLFNPHRNVV